MAAEVAADAASSAAPAMAEALRAPVDESGPEPVEEAPARRRGARTRAARPARKAAEPEIDTRVGAHVVTRRGLPELHINGEPVAPVLFFGNVEGPKEARRVSSEVRRAQASGVRLLSTLVEIPCPLPPDDTVYETLDSRLQALLEANPEAWIIPRLVFVPAPGWMRQYPNEVTHYADGKTADPSIASNRFWTDAEHALAAIIEHLQRVAYGERIVGYHLERGEWFNPNDNGYDRSFASREAFREWLREKYKNSVVGLRAAWYDADVQFHTAEIPTQPANLSSEMAFFEPRRQRRWIDFVEYTSDITASRLIALSRVVKSASSNRALVSVCYGYTFEFEHTFSGHLALGRLLSATSIDLLSGPASYKDRQAGGAGSFPGPVDSMRVHGKLWLSEDDTKTHLAPNDPTPDDFNPRLESRQSTEAVHLRAMGNSLAHQSGVAWMDLWGEGWLDSDDIWARIGEFQRRYADFIKARRTETPEVVALLDERSLFHVQRGPAFMRRILGEQREAIQRCGASVGFYLQSDVTSRNFPTDAKLYLFLNPYRLPAAQRAAIREKLQNCGKTLVWMYAVGTCDERGEPEETAHDLVGISLRQQSWNSETGSRIVEVRHPITERVQPREFGVRERLNPSFYVDDDEPGLRVLAEYQQSGLPSLAAREFADWRSVYCGEPALNLELLRGLCRYAGVHLYTAMPDDYVAAGFGFIASHSTRDGNRTLLIPRGAALYDMLESRLLVEGQAEYRAFVKGNTTRLFFAGTLDEMRKLGLPGTEKPKGRARKLAAPASLPQSEPESVGRAVEWPLPLDSVSSPIPSDILPLFDVSEEEGDGDHDSGGEGPASGEEESADGNGAQPGRRRRRRRGGRGRGRRRGGSETAGAPAADSAPPPEG